MYPSFVYHPYCFPKLYYAIRFWNLKNIFLLFFLLNKFLEFRNNNSFLKNIFLPNFHLPIISLFPKFNQIFINLFLGISTFINIIEVLFQIFFTFHCFNHCGSLNQSRSTASTISATASIRAFRIFIALSWGDYLFCKICNHSASRRGKICSKSGIVNAQLTENIQNI